MNLHLISSSAYLRVLGGESPCRIPQKDSRLKSGQYLRHDASQSDGLRCVNEYQAGDYDTSLS